MQTPLLTTKLYIPPLRPTMVARARLLRRLAEGLHLRRRLTLISAPAGFGKTTLLSEWVDRLRSPSVAAMGDTPLPQAGVAWLSLDEGDGDFSRFLTYLLAALRTVQSDFGLGVESLLHAPQPPPVGSLLTALANEMSALPHCVVLVLDDYHAIQAQPVHDALAFLLDHLLPPPEGPHLVIASRADPPLPLPRLRGRGQVTELREADLRFTPSEAGSFLNTVTGLSLSAEDIAALEARTEGWITGLQLAAISMQGRSDPSSFIKAFTGSNRYVLDYLTEEVLAQQPERVRSFLLQTSILARLSGPLCDAVVQGGQSRPVAGIAAGAEEPRASSGFGLGAQRMLEYLETHNLFLVPLDDERRWYRYHRLFADLLRARLEEAQPGRVAELHRRASAWFEEQGALDETVTHALMADDLALARRLVEAYGMAALTSGELMTLARWIGSLPDGNVDSSPILCVLHAWVLLLTGQLAVVEPYLKRAESLLTKSEQGDLPGSIAAIRAYVAAQQGDAARTIELGHQGLEQLDEGNYSIRGVVYFALGAAYMQRGDTVGASRAFRQASDVAERGGNLHLAAPALNALAGIEIQQGRLRQAQRTAQEAVQLASDPTGQPLPFAAGPISALADVAYEWNELEAAQAYAQQSVELSRQWGSGDSLCASYLTLSGVLRARGDLDAAGSALRDADGICHELATVPHFGAQLRATQALLWLARGDLAAATRWAEDTKPEPIDLLRVDQNLALARVWLALERWDRALAGLADILKVAGQQGLNGAVIKALVLQAVARRGHGEDEQALVALTEALALAEAEGFVRSFLDEGDLVVALLRKAAIQDPRGYASGLLVQAGSQPQAPVPIAAATGDSLIESPSQREMEVLRLIAAGRSNREIANELFVAVSTVKSHANHIYGKLGVRNRTEAVARAQELGLL